MAFPTFVKVVRLDEANFDKMRGARRYCIVVEVAEGDSLPDLLEKVERVEGDKTVELAERSRVM